MSVVGLDVGNDTLVAAAARQRGIDVLLNAESKRESPAAVAFSHSAHLLGAHAAGAASSHAFSSPSASSPRFAPRPPRLPSSSDVAAASRRPPRRIALLPTSSTCSRLPPPPASDLNARRRLRDFRATYLTQRSRLRRRPSRLSRSASCTTTPPRPRL
ncbi:hypothetical protein ZWY2020_049843 [Hordeum vulgare]|nr:hypothetical protein ZWY2020_049843 [Hordeum vulgare]